MALDLDARVGPARWRARLPGAHQVAPLFLQQTTSRHLLLMAGLPVLVGAWLLLSPQHMLSRAMTWDLLFNLTGAWGVHNGLVPHVDYHDPVGVLGILLTSLGFHIVGPSPRAFLVGEEIFLVLAFATACMGAKNRLPPLAAAIFVLYVSLLVLLPTNLGDKPNNYSFAMSYNRWGWSVLSTLCLILFLPPRVGHRRARLDVAIGLLLLLVMFYLKITFFAAGLVAVMAAMILMPHVRADWRLWGASVALLAVYVVAPHNHAYLSDLWQASRSGYARVDWGDHVRSFLVNKAEYALYISVIVVLFWQWRSGRAPLHAALAAAFLFCLGLFVLSQNTQAGTVPLGIVLLLLVYNIAHAAPCPTTAPQEMATLSRLTAILVFPALSVAAAAISLAGYHVTASHNPAVLAVDQTNLRGLAVPADEDEPYLLKVNGRVAADGPSEGSQAVYIQALLEAASLFADGQRGHPRLMVADQLNPLPFVIGLPPPRGANLWSYPGAPDRTAEEVYGDVDYVLIPRFVIVRIATAAAQVAYDKYLSEHFAEMQQTRYWTVLSRRYLAHGLLMPE